MMESVMHGLSKVPKVPAILKEVLPMKINKMLFLGQRLANQKINQTMLESKTEN